MGIKAQPANFMMRKRREDLGEMVLIGIWGQFCWKMPSVQFQELVEYTPWKINMECTNHPFRKENDLPNLHDHGPC